MNRTLNLLAGGLLALSLSGIAIAQAKPSEAQATESKPSEARPTPNARDAEYEANRVTKTYYLANVTQQNDANEILIAVRNLLSPRSKLYLVASENAIVLAATPEDQTAARQIINELDRPKKTYRLTFTLAESDSGKRIGVQHFSIVVVAGQRTSLKQGSKVPVMTGSTSDPQQTQFQYLDIGMNFDTTVQDLPGGLYLKTKVEQSSLADEHMSGPLAPEPIVRQTALEGMSALTLGKPLTLGSVDVPGSTRHIDIEVVAEPIS
jgi:type II secretory pathway component GspD/PulD (secretin)